MKEETLIPKKMTVYACGGTGCNIASSLTKFAGKSSVGFANIETFFIDTSRSNITPDIPASNVFLVNGKDGSGGLRSENHVDIEKAIEPIMSRFQPGHISVVIHSLSGGSGSVAGPKIVKRLLSEGKDVVVLAVGGTESAKQVENTYKGFLTYEHISQETGAPVCMVYRENHLKQTPGQINDAMQAIIVTLATLFSGQNHGLDTADLHNFLHYHRVSGYRARLSQLELYTGRLDKSDDYNSSVVSMISLNEQDTHAGNLGATCEYYKAGYMNATAQDAVKVDLPLIAAVSVGAFTPIVERLKEINSSYERQRRSVQHDPLDLGTHDVTNGLVL